MGKPERYTLTDTGRAALGPDPDAVRAAAKALERDVRHWPTDLLVEMVDTMQSHSWARFFRRHPRSEADLAEFAESVDIAADFALRWALADRANAARAELVEKLAAALETGDADAFRRLSARYRSWPDVFKRYLLAWNGVEVPGFDGAGYEWDMEVSELTNGARRLRLADESRA